MRAGPDEEGLGPMEGRTLRRPQRERCGEIGPIRREIVFEPLPSTPAPAEPPVRLPDPPREAPEPART